MKWIYLMATLIIIPLALVVCGFLTISFAIDKYVRENHKENHM